MTLPNNSAVITVESGADADSSKYLLMTVLNIRVSLYQKYASADNSERMAQRMDLLHSLHMVIHGAQDPESVEKNDLTANSYPFDINGTHCGASAQIGFQIQEVL